MKIKFKSDKTETLIKYSLVCSFIYRMFDSYLLIANRIRFYIAEAGSEKPRDITKSTINYKNKQILFGKFDFKGRFDGPTL